MRVSEVMTDNPSCCIPQDTVQKAAILMRDKDTGVVPIVENQQGRRLIGMVTDRDLCVEVIANGKDGARVKLEECMTRNPVSCEPDDDLEKVMKLMTENQIRRIAITDGHGAIQGIVSLADVVLRGETKAGK